MDVPSLLHSSRGRRLFWALCAGVALVTAIAPSRAEAQTFGAELHNTMMPASGGMAGVSIARPQDVPSALGGNPATLAQFQGTQFTLGGGWTEPTINIDNDATLPIVNISPYEAKSGRPGSTVANLAVTQDFSAFGLPVTWGAGVLTLTGLGIDFRAVDQSNGTSAELAGFGVATGVGARLTERLSVGAELVLGVATLDGPFAGISAAVPDYALRGNVGLTYDLTDYTTFGFHWLTRQSFNFDDAIRLVAPGGGFSAVQDIDLALPETFGWGVANDRLLNGRLLVASDILLKRYSDADFFRAIWRDQFVFQVGSQYRATRRVRLRLGYAYAENIMRDLTDSAIGGVIPPDGLAGVKYVQAQFPAINQHRISGGVGVRDFLPGVDLDLFAGGMFEANERFG